MYTFAIVRECYSSFVSRPPVTEVAHNIRDVVSLPTFSLCLYSKHFSLEIQMKYTSVDHLGAVWHIQWWYQFFYFWSIDNSSFLFSFSHPRQPPVSESHWRVLLQDMLTMQQNVYTCLDSDACYEVTGQILVFPFNF